MKTKNQLAKKLSAYSIFAGAFLAAEKSDAQIVYVNIVPDDTLSATPYWEEGTALLDLNNDGQYDYRIYANYWWPAILMSRTYSMVWNAVEAAPGAGYSSFDSNRYPYVLNSGDIICISSPWAWLGTSYNGPKGVLYGNGGSGNYGMWTGGVNDKFLGLRFRDTNFQDHYAWLRIDVAADGSFVILKDYAYSANPDSCILAGQGMIPTTIEATNAVRLIIHPNPAAEKIFLSTSNEDFNDADVSCFDLSGRKIFSQKIGGGKNEIDVSSLSEGMYLLEVKNKDVVLTKKFEVSRK